MKKSLERERNTELLGDVTDFLHKIYSSIAETLPDVRDDAGGAADDPNSGILELETEYQPGVSSKPRKKRRSVVLRDRSLETRYLPPGSMKEYWVQYTRQSKLKSPASFPCFWRVALAMFQKLILFDADFFDAECFDIIGNPLRFGLQTFQL